MQSDKYQNNAGCYARKSLCCSCFFKQACNPLHTQNKRRGKSKNRQTRTRAVKKGEAVKTCC